MKQSGNPKESLSHAFCSMRRNQTRARQRENKRVNGKENEGENKRVNENEIRESMRMRVRVGMGMRVRVNESKESMRERAKSIRISHLTLSSMSSRKNFLKPFTKLTLYDIIILYPNQIPRREFDFWDEKTGFS